MADYKWLAVGFAILAIMESYIIHLLIKTYVH